MPQGIAAPWQEAKIGHLGPGDEIQWSETDLASGPAGVDMAQTDAVRASDA